MALYEVNREAKRAIHSATKCAEHALSELASIHKGGVLDEERLTGIRSELLHAGLYLTSAMDDGDALIDTTDALKEVAEHGSGYPI